MIGRCPGLRLADQSDEAGDPRTVVVDAAGAALRQGGAADALVDLEQMAVEVAKERERGLRLGQGPVCARIAGDRVQRLEIDPRPLVDLLELGFGLGRQPV